MGSGYRNLQDICKGIRSPVDFCKSFSAINWKPVSIRTTAIRKSTSTRPPRLHCLRSLSSNSFSESSCYSQDLSFLLILTINIGRFRENFGRFSVDSVSVDFLKSSVDSQSILILWFSLHTWYVCLDRLYPIPLLKSYH